MQASKYLLTLIFGLVIFTYIILYLATLLALVNIFVLYSVQYVVQPC